MKKLSGICFALASVAAFAALAGGQQSAPKPKPSTAPRPAAAASERPLVLTEAIPLPGVKGRFDHFATGGGKLFVSALGNNSVEVIGTGGRTLDYTITGVPGPQGEAFSPEANKIFSASGTGKVYVYDGKTYDLITTVDFPGGADNLRYDAPTKRVYVGCGNNEKTGAIGMIDAMTNQKLDEQYLLGGEPESFQLERSGPNIYVNLPDLKQIAVINRTTKAVTKWNLTLEGNFPMALDEADHRLFIGTHQPARMAVFDTTSGKMIAALPSVQDTDDLYYDAAYKRIYMPGGEGFIYVFQMDDPDHYRLLAKVPTVIGAKTAGHFGSPTVPNGNGPRIPGKGFDRFYLAVPVHGNDPAEIRIYTAQD
jgi:DNA-binding beta-propeller fold protein YncE